MCLDAANGKLILSKIQNGMGGGFLQTSVHWELRPVGKDEFLADDEGNYADVFRAAPISR